MYFRFSSNTPPFCCAATLSVISARSTASSFVSTSISAGFTAPAIVFACFSHALFRSASNAASNKASERESSRMERIDAKSFPLTREDSSDSRPFAS